MRISKAEANELSQVIARLARLVGMAGHTGDIDAYSPEVDECLRILNKAGIPVDMEMLPMQAFKDAHGK